MLVKLEKPIKTFLKMNNKAKINWFIIDKYFYWIARRKLENRDFSIIANNCTAGGIYHKFKLTYNTPTVGLFFFYDDYMKLLENLEHYLKQPLKFVKCSRHPEAQNSGRHYPIGVLGSDVEVHFLHYKSEEEAREKWCRRLTRIRFDNLFIIFANDHEEFFQRFENLPYENRLMLTCRQTKYPSAVFVKDFSGRPEIGDSAQSRNYEKQIDIVKWLNGVKDFRKS